MKVKRKIIEIDEELCNGCGQCVPSCAEGALEIVDGKARVIAERYCDGLGACLGECPTGALRVVERLADDFDEEAVEEFLAAKKATETKEVSQNGCACPSAKVVHFQLHNTDRSLQPQSGVLPASHASSFLSHWPVQIRLVPPTAPFLKNADLLVAADCTAVAYAGFQQDFLQGRVVLLGCPKFDDAEGYIRKFTEIFQKSDIRSVTLLIMEVPCCGGMRMIIREALKRAGKEIAVKEAVIGIRGEVLRQGEMGVAV